MSYKEIYEYLKFIDCCNICILRFLNGRRDDYFNIDESFKKRGITITPDTINDDTAETKTDVAIDHSVCIKRKKPNICYACLGLFNDAFLIDTLEKIASDTNLKTYNCDKLLTSLSLPISLHLRQLTLWIGLLKKFPGKISTITPPDVPLKEVYKSIINPKVCEAARKEFEQNQNGIMVNLYYEYKNDENELEKLKLVDPKLFAIRERGRKYRKEFLTRTAFEKNFIPDKINIDDFIKYIPFPPAAATTPTESITLNEIKVTGPTVFVAGRYRKLSRELSQTPWILNGKRFLESSVEELINEPIAQYFNVNEKSITFAASGREDIDVRCLGNGRPFYLEIPDSHEINLSYEKAAEIENAIKKSNKVSVQHLQMVKRNELINIKTGEEHKKKIYRALCILKEDATVDLMKKLMLPNGFLIQQITPLRVLHRRPLHTRPRQIYSVQGFVDKNNHKLIILDITTQAGTYVKELIHGEFGRTHPSIFSIIDQWIDIVSLDVLNVELDWPLEINNKREACKNSNNNKIDIKV